MQTLFYNNRNESLSSTNAIVLHNDSVPDKNYANEFAVYLPDGSAMIAYDDALPKLASEYTPRVLRNLSRYEFVPIVINKEYGKIYRCPCCGTLSGALAPLNPRRVDLFPHTREPPCLNINKIPVEE